MLSSASRKAYPFLRLRGLADHNVCGAKGQYAFATKSTSSCEMDTFRYEGRLTGRNIRLIRILPLRVPDPYSRLEIILVSRPLNGADYDALSYVWGDPAVQHEIICNGQSMRIGTSLMEALISRRVISAVSLDAGGSGTKKTAQQGIFREWVWADAICINQSDVIEKTEQVRMMTEIYSNAGQVNIWLGMHKDGDREAIAFLVDLWNLFQDRLKLDFDTLQNGQLREIAPEFDSIIKAPYWKSVYDILSHPCFSRAWVVQELVFARHVLIQRGLISPSVDALFWTVTLLRQYSLDLGYWQHKYDIGPATMMAQIRANFKRTGPNSPLHGWLGACTTMQATDPRDKFFALFGLSKGEDTNFINYSMTFREVACHSGLRALIGHSSGAEGSYGPDQLAWSANPQSRSMGLPSWVPDWFTSSHALRGTHGLPMLFNMTQIRVLGLTPKQEYRGLQSVANSGVKPTKRQIFSRILKVMSNSEMSETLQHS